MPRPHSSRRLILLLVALLAACGGDGPAAPSSSTDGTVSTGFAVIDIKTASPDFPDYLYLLQVDDADQGLWYSGYSAQVQGDPTSTHRIRLLGVPFECTTFGDDDPVHFDSLVPTPVTITVSCPAPQPRAMRIIASTWGGYIGFDRSGNGATSIQPSGASESPKGMPLWSPDGKWLAYPVPDSSGGDDLTIIDADQGIVTQRVWLGYLLEYGPGWAAWSPDGSRIAAPAPSGLQIIPAAGGPPVEIPGGVRRVDWSRDGTLMAGMAFDSLIVMDPTGANRRAATAFRIPDSEGVSSYVSQLRLSPDHSQVALMTSAYTGYGFSGFGCDFFCNATGTAPHALWVAKLDGHPPVFLAASAHGTFAWWPDGSRIVYDDSEGRTTTIDPAGQGAPVLQGRSGLVFPAADGSDVLLATGRGIVSATGGQEQLPSYTDGSLLHHIIDASQVPAVRP
jgi:hypothetical protein